MESKLWNPSHWQEKKIARYLLHVFKHAKNECAVLAGPHEGNIIAAEMYARYREHKSAALLAARGVPTIGAK